MVAEIALAAVIAGLCLVAILLHRSLRTERDRALRWSKHLENRERVMRQTLMRRTREAQLMQASRPVLRKQPISDRPSHRAPLPDPVEEPVPVMRFVDDEESR